MITILTGVRRYSFGSVSYGNRNKNKKKQMRPIEIEKLLHSKGTHQQNQKTTYWMGENTGKWYDL